MRQIVFQHQGDFGLHFRLQHRENGTSALSP
jgi:hypothetical protein